MHLKPDLHLKPAAVQNRYIMMITTDCIMLMAMIYTYPGM